MPLKTLQGTTVCHKTTPSLPRARGLRVSVPRIIVEAMDLHAGDALHWTLDLATGRLAVEKTERPKR